MLIVDSDEVIQGVNLQALAMLVWSREVMVGSGVEALISSASRSRHE